MKSTQEEDRVPGKRVMTVLVGVLVITAAFVLTAWLWADCRVAELGGGPGPVAAPVEKMQQVPEGVKDMMVLYDEPAPVYEQRDKKIRRLHGYGWVERDAGLIHIPIERAMELSLRERRTPAEEGARQAPSTGREQTQEQPP